MTIASIATVSDILNRVAVEVGHNVSNDPYTDNDNTFIKLRTLMNIAGEELAMAYPWEFLVKSHSIQTSLGDTGIYPLPADFYYMIHQTGWERTENQRLGGPLSPQDWTYLLGRDIVASTINVLFRINEGQLKVFPTPPPVGLDINFEYVSTRWVRTGGPPPGTPYTYTTAVSSGTDAPLYDKTLFSRYLKLKWLEMAGFDTTKAADDFAQAFSFVTGREKSAPVLNMGYGRRGRSSFYLDGFRSVPDTNFGM